MLAPFTRAQLQAAGPYEVSDALESGKVAYFPPGALSLPLPAEDDLRFLRDELGKHLVRKNVSYYPDGDRLVGVGEPTVVARTRQLLAARSREVQALLAKVIPKLAEGLRVGTSSFRPLQERGRNLKPHASNELVHIDAGAYGATHGDRILRVFTNLHPTEDRVWASMGSFTELYRDHARAAGLLDAKVAEGALDKLFTGMVSGVASLGLPKLKMIDSSPYDRLMRRFHNFMKDSPEFQRAPGRRELTFPPLSSWMVLTDTVSHACVSGQHALVDTFIVPLASCRLRELAPYFILEQSSGATR